MAVRGFLPDLKSWTVGEIARAAGLVAFSAGAGYCIYRSLRRERAPPDRTQPSHEPVDVLRESLDTPSLLQVVEPILQLPPTEPQDEPSAVILPLDAGEPNSACCDVRFVSADSSSSQSEPVDIRRVIPGMIRGPESRLCGLETVETHHSIHKVVEPHLHLLPNEQQEDPSAVLLPLDAGELISACRNIQFLSADTSISQSESVNIRTYLLWMIRGPECRLCWFTTTKTQSINHMGFPYHTTTEDCFTGIQVESGRVTEFISCNRVETDIIVPGFYYVQTIKQVTCTYLFVGKDGQMDTSTWEKEEVPVPYAESDESFNPEEMEVPFICCHLSDRGVTDVGLKLPALREAFATLLASIHNQNFLFLVGKKIVMRLAAANIQDVVGVKLAYEALIRFLRTPSHQDSIEAEISSCVPHYNFLDVFFELILFRHFRSGSTLETFNGGFLERLLELISMWDVDVWEPAAELYFTVLIDHLTQLAEVLFSQPLELYSDPAALATTVQHLLKKHVQQMMDTLEKL
ncbi:uncharacterized protein LOC132852206 isoform X1 [Tachysurus vachellii]|uniref:uncharacterized protein LOC132852169 isoform X1 n=1 Tax=Tachysurus vachellii TaxID=175792 RepID=UPI00296B34D2|nr:uncharacterized protein LOC132852169 isoform X1 [Tachysurus vachellii]XP_060735236.1 uncharacterized protein LOC132852178 isoform X1 [Tachysurus vachellii]XP_060735266.1 uncharacterized protein LOC132852206 isoform X1 [Tachysurus vachellii]